GGLHRRLPGGRSHRPDALQGEKPRAGRADQGGLQRRRRNYFGNGAGRNPLAHARRGRQPRKLVIGGEYAAPDRLERQRDRSVLRVGSGRCRTARKIRPRGDEEEGGKPRTRVCTSVQKETRATLSVRLFTA